MRGSIADELGEDELFRPSLTAADDAVGFTRPWNPWSLVFVVFFCGPLWGGALATWNFMRLGQPLLVPVGALIFAVGYVLGAAGLYLAVRSEAFADTPDIVSFFLRLSWVVPAGIVGLLQRRRFTIYTGHQGEPGRVWPLGLAAYALHHLTFKPMLGLTMVILAMVFGGKPQ